MSHDDACIYQYKLHTVIRYKVSFARHFIHTGPGSGQSTELVPPDSC